MGYYKEVKDWRKWHRSYMGGERLGILSERLEVVALQLHGEKLGLVSVELQGCKRLREVALKEKKKKQF